MIRRILYIKEVIMENNVIEDKWISIKKATIYLVTIYLRVKAITARDWIKKKMRLLHKR